MTGSPLTAPTREWPGIPGPRPREVWADWGPEYFANGLLGFVFSATGPVAIILSAAARGGLSAAELASWLFGAFFLNGAITLFMSWRFRMPLCFYWTIPGTVLVGQSLQHLTFPEIIGGYYLSALLILAVGMSGLVRRAVAATPMPIVMAMVAGVFLRFGTDLVRTLAADPAIAWPMVLAFVLLGATALKRRLPPLIGALVVGVGVTLLLGRADGTALGPLALVHPVLWMPHPSWAVLAELVVPLAVTVLVVQNGQGFAILTQLGHAPPVNTCTVVSGLGSLLGAAVGATSTCITGPTAALVTSGGEPRRQYTAALTLAVLAMAFGLLAPTVAGLLLAAPKALIAVLGGLAMLRVLHVAFATSFSGRFGNGALISFLVTVTDVPVLNIGGAFWGLVAGLAVSALLDRPDWQRPT